MTYEQWRISFQDSEQAARAAFRAWQEAEQGVSVPNEHGKNRYGLDMSYFRNLFNRELNRPLVDFRPSELARVLARASRTADASVLLEPEFQAAQSVVEPDEHRLFRCYSMLSRFALATRLRNIEALDECLDAYDKTRKNYPHPPIPLGVYVSQGLIEFAKKCLQASRDGCGVDGADIQDWALECGLIEPYQATESCGDDCVCAEVSEFPVECYRDSALLRAQQPPEQE